MRPHDVRVESTLRSKRIPGSKVMRLAHAILSGERRDASVNIVFIGDARMRSLNRRFRGRDRTTDVLSFSLEDENSGVPQGMAVGEVYVSCHQAAIRAKKENRSVDSEILFLVAHGLLHLLGYDHPDARGYDLMIRKQERYVSMIAGER